MSDLANLGSQKHNNEIDLIEIIRVLWDKKWWIVLITFVTTLLAGVYAFSAKEQWTSKATVIAPKVADMRNYLALRSEYANILNVKDFSSQTIVDNLFNNFKTTLFSNNVKKEFLTQSKWFEEYATGSSEDKRQKLISEMVGTNFLATIPDLKKDPNALGINISFATDTPTTAQKVLEEYISFVNKTVLVEDKIDFLADIDIAINNLKLQKDKIQRDTQNTRQVQLENLKNALDIAKSAEIKEYSKTIGDLSVPQVTLGDAQIPFTDSKLSDGTYLFMLGEKYLQAQVDILTKNKVVYPVSFYTIEKQVSLLKELAQKVDGDIGVSGYYYLNSPDYPASKDKPKAAVILLISVLVGLLLAISTILLQYLFKRNR